jgi:hypothetical protein
MTTLALTLALLLGTTLPQSPDHQHDEMTRRGDAVMGFSHRTTTHHFRLRSTGGEIEATAKDPNDEESVSQIRGHFLHLARMFGEGTFTAPILIHAQNPPGAAVMAARKHAIAYVVESIAAGARIRITTSDETAIEAIHSFLRFQITDHRTGDPLTIQK